MQSVATTMQDDAVTSVVARKALDVSAVVVRSLDEATRSGQTSDIVAATVEVYSGVTEYLNTANGAGDSSQKTTRTEQIETLKRDLKARAGSFCDALTDNSAPDAAPLSSTSKDFLFSCQKIQTRAVNSTENTNDYQACDFACVSSHCL